MNRKIWPRASIALNALLLGVVAALVVRQPPGPEAAVAGPRPSAGPTTRPAVAPSRLAARHDPPGAGRLGTPADGRSWIDQLRAAGVPDKTLARLVLADFQDRWQSREEDFQRKYVRGEVDLDQYPALLEERDREQEKELRAALGEPGFRDWDMENTLAGLNLQGVKLTAHESTALYELQKDLQRRFRDLDAAKRRGEIDDAGCAEAREKAQTGFDQRLQALLGEQRHAARPDVDEETGELRRTFRSLNPTAAQFQALVEAQRQWAERRAELDRFLQQTQTVDEAYTDDLQVIDLARDEEYRRVLGAGAFDALQRARDNRYLAMKRYAQLWDIDDRKIEAIYGTIRNYEQVTGELKRRAGELERQGQTIDWEVIDRDLGLFARQTEQSLRQYLGDDRFDRMKKNEVFPFQ